MVGIEPPPRVLLGLPATLVLAGDHPGNETQEVGRAALRPQLDVAARFVEQAEGTLLGPRLARPAIEDVESASESPCAERAPSVKRLGVSRATCSAGT